MKWIRNCCCLAAVLASAVVSNDAAYAQSAGVSGTVLNASTSRPIANAVVTLDAGAAATDTHTDANGAFAFATRPAGTFHLIVKADGYLTTRTELSAASASTVEIKVPVDPHFTEVVTVSPDARSQLDAYQPTSVLAGQELATHLQGTLGATLSDAPGVAMRSFGPGPARPVIRGLDGDRVLILENGTRMGDLSSQSGDHGVNINPASASKIEVVRGPATLLYGANAIGGVVNVITKSIPMAPVAKPTGTVTLDAGSAASEAGGAADITAGVGHFAFHAAGSGRRSSDYNTPDGRIPNSFNRAGFVDAGMSYVGANGYVGGSVAYDRTHYGIPLVEEGETNLDPRRTLVDVKAERRNMSGPFTSVRASIGVRRYHHDELDGDEVSTSFANSSNEFEVLAAHRPIGRLKGTIGGWGLTRSFSATGEEALSPPVDQSAVAGFLYEEAALSSHTSLQFGGRVDHTAFTPGGDLTARSFTNLSGSVGLLVRPTEQTTLSLSLARAVRNPALEELYFHGPHGGNNAFENGSDTLQSERATGFDASFRWQGEHATGEVSFFANRVNNFIYRAYTGEVDDDLPVTFFTQGDARLVGVEAHTDIHVINPLWIEAGLDYMHGDLTSESTPLPRMPPTRGRLGLRYQHNAFQAGVEAAIVARQDRVFIPGTDDPSLAETPTDGYNLFKLYAAHSFVAGGVTHTLAARLENAGNTLYHNHLNYLKDLAPEVGRDFRVSWTIGF